MTPLGREIAETIEAEGPMRLDRYMALALSHPTLGYYATRDPFGPRGDFVTAPEISQMFGELLGLWAAEVWRMMGSPTRFALVELGPGRGTLMADMLRACRAAPGFLDATEVVLVETSPTLRDVQAKTLRRTNASVRWAASIDEALPPLAPIPQSGEGGVAEGDAGRGELGPSQSSKTSPSRPDADAPGPPPRSARWEPAAAPAIVISNEFFDALPIRQFLRTDRGWRERVVGLSDQSGLTFGLSPEPTSNLTLPEAPEGAVREVCTEAIEIMARIATHVAAHGGACLGVDYGYGAGFGDTLQAMKAHAFVDPLAEPGEADLTAHVDFAALAATAERQGAAVLRLISQADLLERLGLSARAEQLARTAAPSQREAISTAVARLTNRAPRGMGALFKALAISDPRLGPLPGFEPRSRAALDI